MSVNDSTPGLESSQTPNQPEVSQQPLTIDPQIGLSVIRYPDGRLVESRHYDEIIASLQRGKQLTRRTELLNDLEPMERVARWGFPERNAKLRDVIDVVYFGVLSHDPEAIKIGCTRKLSIRSKQIGWDCNDEFIVLAYASTVRYKRLEQALHIHFEDFHFGNEWFQAAPVLEHLAKWGYAE